MQHPNLAAWEKRLNDILRDVDRLLEERYGNRLPLHPSRPPEGQTANPIHDGLFAVTAKFSAGFGSKLGRGYVIDIRVATLDSIPDALRKELESDVAEQLRARLPEAFPGTDIRVDKDGAALKIHGDLSLGTL